MMSDMSILTSIKKMLGIQEEYESFDDELVLHINAALEVARQIGASDVQHFRISDDTAMWEDFFGDGEAIETAKEYVYLKTKMLFDPPQAGPVINAYNDMIKELEWRISVMHDTIVRKTKTYEEQAKEGQHGI